MDDHHERPLCYVDTIFRLSGPSLDPFITGADKIQLTVYYYFFLLFLHTPRPIILPLSPSVIVELVSLISHGSERHPSLNNRLSK